MTPPSPDSLTPEAAAASHMLRFKECPHYPNDGMLRVECRRCIEDFWRAAHQAGKQEAESELCQLREEYDTLPRNDTEALAAAHAELETARAVIVCMEAGERMARRNALEEAARRMCSSCEAGIYSDYDGDRTWHHHESGVTSLCSAYVLRGLFREAFSE